MVPFGVKDPLKGKRVVEIIKENGLWNEELIKEVFLPVDVDTILSMPRRKSRTDDVIIWSKDPKGLFSIKKKR